MRSGTRLIDASRPSLDGHPPPVVDLNAALPAVAKQHRTAMIESRTGEVPSDDTGVSVKRQRGGATGPSRVVHTDIAFVAIAITGLVALVVGIWVTASGPPPMKIELYAISAISYGATAVIAGGIGAPIVISMARRDRASLALVRSQRPNSLALPGAVSNHVLLRSLRALNPSAITPRSVVWAVDRRGMELWQPGYASPTLTVPWNTVISSSTREMPHGRAVIAVAVLELSDGHELRLAFWRRFGGITLMSQGRLEDVLHDFAGLRTSPGFA